MPYLHHALALVCTHGVILHTTVLAHPPHGALHRLLCSRQQWDTLTDTVTTIATTVPAADMETNKPNNPLPTNHTARTLAHTAATPDRDTPVPRNGDDHDVDAQDTMPLFGAPWVNRGGRFGATLHVAA